VTGHVVALFALDREADPFRRAAADRTGIAVAVCGVGPASARRAAEAVTRRDPPAAVVVAGFAGALWPGLAVGDVVTAAEVVDEAGGRWRCADVGQGTARVLTTSRLIGSPAEKRALGERHLADVVDMESAAVAQVCEARGVPFLAVRAVSDTVDTALSPRLVKLLSGGKASPLKAALALIRQPSLVGEFRRLARDTKFAAKTLAAALVEIVAPQSG
jgi:adenosylhomocysteine nucleosidase